MPELYKATDYILNCTQNLWRNSLLRVGNRPTDILSRFDTFVTLYNHRCLSLPFALEAYFVTFCRCLSLFVTDILSLFVAVHFHWTYTCVLSLVICIIYIVYFVTFCRYFVAFFHFCHCLSPIFCQRPFSNETRIVDCMLEPKETLFTEQPVYAQRLQNLTPSSR